MDWVVVGWRWRPNADFGIWNASLTAAGISLANVSRRHRKHFDGTGDPQAAGPSLTWTAVCLEDRDYNLAIRRVSEAGASAAAGVEETR